MHKMTPFCYKNKKKNYGKRCRSEGYVYIADLSVGSVQESVLDLLSDFCTALASELGFPSVHRTWLHRSTSVAVRYCWRQAVGSATVQLCTPLHLIH